MNCQMALHNLTETIQVVGSIIGVTIAVTIVVFLMGLDVKSK